MVVKPNLQSVTQAFLTLTCCITILPAASADVQLARVFGDHMILQADMPLRVWGEAAIGERVTVSFNGTTRSALPDESGRWLVEFPPQTASGTPAEILVEGSNRITLHDVLVGEVWICAGQSNMEFPLKSASDGIEAISHADQPLIRLLHLQGAARGGSNEYDEGQLARMSPDKFCSGSWVRCDRATAKDFSAVAYYFGRELQRSLDAPVGLICPAIGGTPAEAWVSREALAAVPDLAPMVRGNWLENKTLDEWCRDRAKSNFKDALDEGISLPGDDLGPYHSFKPGFMWQAGIAPLIPLSVRGVIWYQGESNAESPRRVAQHQQIFETLAGDWRSQWDQTELPFLFVQLPALNRPTWPAFRQSQLECLRSIKNTGMVVTIDLGHPTNVHPTDKRPVGERLAQSALSMVYMANASREWSGPIVRHVHAAGRTAIVEFDHVGTGLISDDGLPLRHFELADESGKYVPALADIHGEQIIVHSEEVVKPQKLRYAWLPYPTPTVNFFNRDGLPASPFEAEVELSTRR